MKRTARVCLKQLVCDALGGGGPDGMRLISKACFFFFCCYPVCCVSTVDSAETGPGEGVPAREKQDDKECFTSIVFSFVLLKSVSKHLQNQLRCNKCNIKFCLTKIFKHQFILC